MVNNFMEQAEAARKMREDLDARLAELPKGTKVQEVHDSLYIEVPDTEENREKLQRVLQEMTPMPGVFTPLFLPDVP